MCQNELRPPFWLTPPRRHALTRHKPARPSDHAPHRQGTPALAFVPAPTSLLDGANSADQRDLVSVPGGAAGWGCPWSVPVLQVVLKRSILPSRYKFEVCHCASCPALCPAPLPGAEWDSPCLPWVWPYFRVLLIGWSGSRVQTSGPGLRTHFGMGNAIHQRPEQTSEAAMNPCPCAGR